MNSKADFNVLTGGYTVGDIANGACGESVASDELSDILMCKNEAEAEVSIFGLSDSELCLVGMFDEAESNKLEEITNLGGSFLHKANFTMSQPAV